MITRTLLEAGANVTLKDRMGRTPLEASAQYGGEENQFAEILNSYSPMTANVANIPSPQSSAKAESPSTPKSEAPARNGNASDADMPAPEVPATGK